MEAGRVAHILGADVATGGRVGEQRLLPRSRRTGRPSAAPCRTARQARPACGRWSRASAPARRPSPGARRWSALCRCTRTRRLGRPSSWRGSDRGVARCTRRSATWCSFAPDRRTTSRISVVVTLTAVAAASRALICCTSSRPRASRSASVVGSRGPHATRLIVASPATADRESIVFHFRYCHDLGSLDDTVALFSERTVPRVLDDDADVLRLVPSRSVTEILGQGPSQPDRPDTRRGGLCFRCISMECEQRTPA